MYDLPENALLPHINPPLQKRMDLSSVPLKDFAKMIEGFEAKRASRPNPETDVLKFYFLNHAFHLLSAKFSALEDLPEEARRLAEARTRITTEISNRVLCHTFLTLLYEINWLHKGEKTGNFYESLKSRFGSNIANQICQSGGTNSFELGTMANYKKLDESCGDYTRAIFVTYTSSPHFSFIGKDKQWIAIASVPSDFFQGYASLEETCDKAFSLFHWGGSIFNKDILYRVNSDTMLHLLDVQDSGQIPQWIAQNQKNKFVDKELLSLFSDFAKIFPEEVKENINAQAIDQAKSKRCQKLNNIIGQRGGGGGAVLNQNQNNKEKAPQIQKIDEIVFGALLGKNGP